MKYRKIPVVIEAVQWNGKNLKEIISFTGLHSSANKWTWEELIKTTSKYYLEAQLEEEEEENA